MNKEKHNKVFERLLQKFVEELKDYVSSTTGE